MLIFSVILTLTLLFMAYNTQIGEFTIKDRFYSYGGSEFFIQQKNIFGHMKNVSDWKSSNPNNIVSFKTNDEANHKLNYKKPNKKRTIKVFV